MTGNQLDQPENSDAAGEVVRLLRQYSNGIDFPFGETTLHVNVTGVIPYPAPPADVEFYTVLGLSPLGVTVIQVASDGTTIEGVCSLSPSGLIVLDGSGNPTTANINDVSITEEDIEVDLSKYSTGVKGFRFVGKEQGDSPPSGYRGTCSADGSSINPATTDVTGDWFMAIDGSGVWTLTGSPGDAFVKTLGS